MAVRSLPKRNPRRALKLVAVNAGLVAAVLLAAELIFGTWLAGRQYGILNLPRDDIRYFDTTPIYEGGGIMLYRRDHNGFRGPYEHPSKIDVLAMGGSTTNERYMAEEKTWVGVLRGNLRAAGRPLTVVNAGVEGHSTVGHLKSFDLWFPLVPGLRPRFVVAYIGLNDVVLEKAEYYDAMRPDNFWRTVRYVFLNNSAFYHAFRVVRGWFRARSAQLAHALALPQGTVWVEADPKPEPRDHVGEYRERLATYADRVRRLAERIRGLGATPVFVTQPRGDYRVRDGRVLLPRPEETVARRNYVRLALFNEVTMNVCREVKAVCLDLARAIEFGEGDFYDRVHTTPRGSRKIGEFMFRELRPHL